MAGIASLSDAELQQLLVQGDDRSFSVLYDRYASAIKGLILKILKSRELTEDIVQEVFIKIWSNRNQLGDVKTLKSYLFTVARNRALDCLKAALRSDATMHEVIHHFVVQRNTTEEGLLDKDYQNFLKGILTTLPDRSREIFSLCREQGKSYEEVASLLGISRNAVKNHMVYSLRILRYATEKELGISLSVLLAMLFQI